MKGVFFLFFMFLLLSCTEPKQKRMGLFFNYPNENSFGKEISVTILVPHDYTDEQAENLYRDWVSQQIISGSAGWYWAEEGEK